MEKKFELKKSYTSVPDIINGEEGQAIIAELKKGEIEKYVIESNSKKLYAFADDYTSLVNVIDFADNEFYGLTCEEESTPLIEVETPIVAFKPLVEDSEEYLTLKAELELAKSEIETLVVEKEELLTKIKELDEISVTREKELIARCETLEKELVFKDEKVITLEDVIEFVRSNKGIELKIKSEE